MPELHRQAAGRRRSTCCRSAGLDPTAATEQWSEEVPAGAVMSTDPKAGDAIRGTDVRLVVSEGPGALPRRPALVGKPWTDVEPKLQETCRRSSSRRPRAYDNTVAAGAVVGFDPPAGTDLKRDQVVTVVVSKGHEPVAVPDVTGQRPEQATTTSRRSGSSSSGRTTVAARPSTKGAGHGRRPGPGDGPVAFGSTVTIPVSAGVPLVTVPDVAGKKQDEAAEVLKAAGLKVRRHEVLRRQACASRRPRPARSSTRAPRSTSW